MPRRPPEADEGELPVDDVVLDREQGHDQQEAVDLGASGQEGHLVAETLGNYAPEEFETLSLSQAKEAA